jgi:hypothetical protein
MSKDKPDSQDAIEPEPSIVIGSTFRDTLYTSRTLVFPDGSTASVIKGRVSASTDKQFAFLKAHPDLELVQE